MPLETGPVNNRLRFISKTDADKAVTEKPGSRQTTNHKQFAVLLLFAVSKEYVAEGIKLYRQWPAPYINKASHLVGKEITNIHQKQNWFRRCGITLLDNAVGLGMGLLAGKIVQTQVEIQGFSNLWGLLATRPVVSESTYEIISFAVEFIIALIVFTLTEHYLEEFRQRRKRNKTADSEVSALEITGK